jgi:hypothetical protein
MSKKKLMALGAMLFAGATLLSSGGCLGSFWQGFWNTGFPTHSRWINLAIDVVNEAVFG